MAGGRLERDGRSSLFESTPIHKEGAAPYGRDAATSSIPLSPLNCLTVCFALGRMGIVSIAIIICISAKRIH